MVSLGAFRPVTGDQTHDDAVIYFPVHSPLEPSAQPLGRQPGQLSPARRTQLADQTPRVLTDCRNTDLKLISDLPVRHPASQPTKHIDLAVSKQTLASVLALDPIAGSIDKQTATDRGNPHSSKHVLSSRTQRKTANPSLHKHHATRHSRGADQHHDAP